MADLPNKGLAILGG